MEADLDCCELSGELLRTTGSHTIILAQSAEHGLRTLRAEAVDLIIMGLPDPSGSWMLDQARAEGRLPRTVVVASSRRARMRKKALDRGAIVVLKPLDLEQVTAVIRSAARRPLSW